MFVLPTLNPNGAVDFIVELSDVMGSQGYDVEILVLNDSNRKTRLPSESVTLTIAATSSRINEQENALLKRLKNALKLLRATARLTRSATRADALIITWEMGYGLLLPSLVAFILRKPTFAIVQNNIAHSLAEYSSVKWKRFLLWTFARARAVICISQDLVGVVEEMGVSREKLVVIPNAIVLDRIRALAKEPVPDNLPADATPIVVSVGRLCAQKGYDLLIAAHAKVLASGLDHRLALIGHGPDKGALKKLATELGVNDSVLFLGRLDNPFSIVARSSLFCCSSRYEGRSLVVAEAAALGVPIVSTNCPAGPREILEDGLYGDLVQVESVDALATAIERHLRNPQRLIAKAAASEKQADRFAIDKSAAEYIKLIGQHLR